MTLDQIEMLEAIVLEGSMQKAAKRLNKSQPSLSVGIKKIEQLYNIKLLSRESYRPELTQEGKVFYKNALPVIESHRALHRVASELGSGTEPQVSICIDPLVDLIEFAPLLEEAKKHALTTQLSFLEKVLEGPIDTLLANDVELSIGHLPSNKTHLVEAKKICNLELVPAAKKGSAIEHLPNIVVISEPDSHSANNVENIWTVTTHLRKEELILQGLGWGLISRQKLKASKGALKSVTRKSKINTTLEIFLMRNSNSPQGPVAQALWNSCKG